jgi:hypothetical protein
MILNASFNCIYAKCHLGSVAKLMSIMSSVIMLNVVILNFIGIATLIKQNSWVLSATRVVHKHNQVCESTNASLAYLYYY